MMSWLGAIALLLTGQAASDEEAQLSTLVAQSNDCLKKQVDQLASADKISLSDQATEDMLATSLRIADAMALARVKTNAGNAK